MAFTAAYEAYQRAIRSDTHPRTSRFRLSIALGGGFFLPPCSSAAAVLPPTGTRPRALVVRPRGIPLPRADVGARTVVSPSVAVVSGAVQYVMSCGAIEAEGSSGCS